MASGDDIRAGRVTGAEDSTLLIAQTTGDRPSRDYNGDFVFLAAPFNGGRQPGHKVDGVVGVGQLAGNGVVGQGGDLSGAGVVGLGGEGRQGTVGAHGVIGFGASGGRGAGAGLFGVSGGEADGAVGICNSNNRSGVFGFNSQLRGAAFGVVGACDSRDGAGVGGTNKMGDGVAGSSTNGFGVHGHSINTHAVYGDSRDAKTGGCAGVFGVTFNAYGVAGVIDSARPNAEAAGVYGAAGIQINQRPFSISYIGNAGLFVGPVAVTGDLRVMGDSTVFGSKSAAGPIPTALTESSILSKARRAGLRTSGKARSPRERPM